MTSIYIEKSIELLVCSYGGTGTTMLIRFLSDYFRCNSEDDGDGLKHTDKIPVSRNKDLKLIYLYGDPIDAVYSLFRREFFNLHSRKLLRSYPKLAPIAVGTTLPAYAEEGVDRLKFQQHFDNWYKRDQFFPVLFIKYERLWENLPILFEYLGIPTDQIDRFPKKRAREIKQLEVATITQNNLSDLYGEFAQRLATYSATIILQPKRTLEQHRMELVKSVMPYLFAKSKAIAKGVLPHRVVSAIRN